MDDWVVDSLVGFLQSPLWTNPVDDFIEHLFYQHEESEKTYSEVYSEYQSMIEQLLAGFTEDLGIKAEQLTDACIKSGNLREKHRKLLQPLLASEDFELFKVIMHQKKLGLEQKASQLQLEQSPSQLPFQPDIEDYQIYKDLQTARMEKEESMLQEALEQSQKEYDQEREKEDQEMEKLVKLAKQESMKFQAMAMKTANDQMELIKMAQEESLKMFRKMNERAETGRMSEFEERQLNETNKSDVVQEDEELHNSIATTLTLSPPRDEPPVYNQKEEQPNLIPLGEWSEASVAEVWVQNAKSELNIATSSDTEVLMLDPDYPYARGKYLHQQGDCLLGNKKIQEDIQKVYSASPHKTRIVKASNWQSVTSGSCIKLPDKMKREGREGERAHKGIITEETTEGMEKCGPRIKSRTGVLCTVIARKLKENETFQ